MASANIAAALKKVQEDRRRTVVSKLMEKPEFTIGKLSLPIHRSTAFYNFDNAVAVNVSGTVPSNGLTSGTTIDFRVLARQPLFVKDLALEWTVAETGG